jgi:hypothetical protein
VRDKAARAPGKLDGGSELALVVSGKPDAAALKALKLRQQAEYRCVCWLQLRRCETHKCALQQQKRQSVERAEAERVCFVCCLLAGPAWMRRTPPKGRAVVGSMLTSRRLQSRRRNSSSSIGRCCAQPSAILDCVFSAGLQKPAPVPLRGLLLQQPAQQLLLLLPPTDGQCCCDVCFKSTPEVQTPGTHAVLCCDR